MQNALLAHRKKGKGKDQKGEKDKKKCTYCKEKGHLKKDGQKKKADETKDDKMSMSNSSEKEKKEGTLTAKVTTMAKSSSNSKFLQLFIANTLTERSTLTCKWIIDLGASSPMSCHHNWLHMSQDISPTKKVWLGDNHYILAKGIGQLHLEMDLWERVQKLTVICSAYYV